MVLDTKESTVKDWTKTREFFFKDYKDYKDKDERGIVAEFIDYLKECSSKYNPNFIFSPYIALVQSSGYGKTRLLMETGRCLPLLYICNRAAQARGYPPRTEKATNFLLRENLDESELKARLETLWNYAVSNADELILNVMDQFNDITETKIWEDIHEMHETRRMVQSKKRKRDKSENVELVVLVIDEAASLAKDKAGSSDVSMLRQLRRAARSLVKDTSAKFMIVFIDTASSIRNFTPVAKWDRSMRPSDNESGEDLRRFHPFILRKSFDILKKPDGTNAGRPLLAQPNCNRIFVLRKIIGAMTVEEAPKEGLLAMILSRVGVTIYPQFKYSSTLVASHMATLLACSNDHSNILCMYVSEPTLADGAALGWTKEKYLTEYALPALDNVLREGAFGAGSAGEIVAQILMLHAFDKTEDEGTKGERGIKCVKLKGYLEQLIKAGDEVDSCISPNSCKNGTVSLNQFVLLEQTQELNEDLFELLYSRSAGGVFFAGQRGADLIVPYKIKDRSFGVILVQVKNWNVLRYDKNYPASATSKLKPGYVFESAEPYEGDFVRIYMSLGDFIEDAEFDELDQTTRSKDTHSLVFPPIRLIGLASPCLTPAVKGKLKMLLQTQLKLTEYMKESVQEKDILPWQKSTLNSAKDIWPFLNFSIPVTRNESGASGVDDVEMEDDDVEM